MQSSIQGDTIYRATIGIDEYWKAGVPSLWHAEYRAMSFYLSGASDDSKRGSEIRQLDAG
jgi:hypothetical protein